MKSTLLRVLLLIMICVYAGQVKAQTETMFTQYMFNETFINPAYVGSHETISTSLFFRKQWVGIDGAPMTQSFTIHAPIKRKKIGLGLSVMNENIGVQHQLLVYGGFSYRIPFPNKSVLSMGMNVGFINDQGRYSEVKTVVPGDLQFASDVNKMFLPNAGFGLYYYAKEFYVGFSIPKLIQNDISPAYSNGVQNNIGKVSAWHYYLTSGYIYKANNLFKLKPSMMLKATQNAPIQLEVNIECLISDFFWIGVGYRTGDAINGLIALELTPQLRFSYSYDFTVSKLQTYNSGSHEFALRYQIVKNKNFISSPRYF